MIFLPILYLLAVISCFTLMPHTTKAYGSLKKIKLLFLWSVIGLAIANSLTFTYICQWLGLSAGFTGLVVVANVPFNALSRLKKCLFILNYMVLVILLFRLFVYVWQHLVS